MIERVERYVSSLWRWPWCLLLVNGVFQSAGRLVAGHNPFWPIFPAPSGVDSGMPLLLTSIGTLAMLTFTVSIARKVMRRVVGARS